MAVDTVSTSSLLNNLADALSSAVSVFPADEQSVVPPADGISLLDVKNDLLLSYLQNLVFLILLRLRNAKSEPEPEETNLDEDVIRKLIELRVYVERGVRPLEGRLRYQIDKVLRAAEETERLAAQKANPIKKAAKKQSNGINEEDSSDASNSGSGSEGSDQEDDEDDEDREETIHRPNAQALAQKMKDSAKPQPRSSSRMTGTETYKPPRITPTAMPLPPSARDRSDGPSRRRKSNLLNEYIDEEMSSAPKAQPSIGSNNTILDYGRSGLSARDREKERERTEYEEKNFVRLPGESKAEKKKARLRGENKRDMFGGEDWTGLGGLGDRINRDVQRGKGKNGVLERRQKRERDTQDGPRGDGLGIGEAFTKRQKVLDDRADRKRKKRG